MFQQAQLSDLNEFFAPLSARRHQSVFFCRIFENSAEVTAFLKKYYEAARRNGVLIDGRIPNPDTRQLSFFSEMMGEAFHMELSFLMERLQKWLPRMSGSQREAVAAAMFSTLQDLQRSGKNENILKNAYVKYMCWLYYKFERIVNRLGAEEPPKIFYDGTVSAYELQMLTVLSRGGADILLLERSGDGDYGRLDPASAWSWPYPVAGGAPFPSSFNLKWLQEAAARETERERAYGRPPAIRGCTNAWMKTPELKEALTGAQARGSDKNFFYNCFIVQYGVEDKLLFSGDLFAFYKKLKNGQRHVCVVSGGIPVPTPEEIAAVRRKPYTTAEQLAADLAGNIQYSANMELQRLMAKSFIDIVLAEGERTAGNLSRLTNKAVYLLCWLKRYQRELFSSWRMPEVAVFILFGKCGTEQEALFLRMLSRLPVDVLAILPNLNAGSVLSDPALLELRYENSLPMEEFPAEQSQMRVSTAAHQAERELDSILYQDTGMFRNHQHAKAETITLQTMYEEIALLWDQELKYRPSFAVTDQTVTMPVLLEKVCGVKDGQTAQYWQSIKRLITPDTMVVRGIPWITSLDANPIKPFATQFLQSGKLLRQKIKSHKAYQYGILRPEIQEYLLDKLQLLLDQRVIAGTYQNGTEYTVIATALNLSKELLRMIQKFDFTKKNPKLIIINTAEKILSLEESILAAFLNLVGFDILFFIPTGYQCIEKHFQHAFAHEQQIGEYLYDLSVPDFNTVQESGRSTIRRLFGRSD